MNLCEEVLIYSLGPRCASLQGYSACLDTSICEQWLSDITDTHCSTTGPRTTDWSLRSVVCVSYTPHSRPKPSITGSWSSPCPCVPESSDMPPTARSLESMFHKQSRDSKSFRPTNVVIAGPNKPLSVYFIGVWKWISCSFWQLWKNMTNNGNY